MELKVFFRTYPEAAVAFSGGVDSAVLLLEAVRYAKKVKAYYADSAFQPAFELEDAVVTAKQIGAPLEVIKLDVLSDDTVTANPADRCYHCKRRIFSAILEHASKDGFTVLLDGTNATDDVNDRPGVRALRELKVLSPLRLCGLGKAEIRAIARENGLRVADKPSYACLATRIPAGTRISPELLEKTEKAEDALRALGFSNFRVRYARGEAKLELGEKERELFRLKEAEIRSLLAPLYSGLFLSEEVRPDE